ncbi:MAG TPA: 2-dehydropantoate 2-reductase, partial [Acidimicrobiales bacterium]
PAGTGTGGGAAAHGTGGTAGTTGGSAVSAGAATPAAAAASVVPAVDSGAVVPVVGAGAIGCGVGAALAEGGVRPLLVSDWEEHVAAVRCDGLRVEEADGTTRTVDADAATTADLVAGGGPFPLAYLASKCQGTRRHAEALAEVLAPDGAVVTVQNGINTDVLAEVLGPQRVLGGVAIFGAIRPAAGRVRRTGSGSWLVVGELAGGRSARAEAVAALTSRGGWDTRVSENVLGIMWSKMINNGMVNPMAVIGGWTVEEVMTHPGARSVCRAILAEGVAVAAAEGVRLEPLPSIDIPGVGRWAIDGEVEKVEEDLLRFGRLFPGTRVSSLQDVDAGRATELPWFTGHIVAAGARRGVPTPVSQAALAAALEIEGGRERTPEWVEATVEAIRAVEVRS